ncbi:UTP--glucose-1-phosphate uridylyltransferase [Actinomyces sp. B33]|uniref:UTP--glucose-1-phosphate uridylyltransferase n=1 Tax=Actinomyces sp. B33 TaxID=2942131 RepID=UPI00233F9D34|nr:UTP--glucose-1-phosphate uridylyltransferase [Actinomyces sp. B33]MDC4232174.1 UTP--glucose-1-phosphate uridylyltransferase [Actinomyces sp. B33]
MTDTPDPVVHAVVPSAGRGTRFLPITKSIPKEMLPIVDRPSIEYIVREATDAGIEDVLFVTRAGKTSIEDYFDAEGDLEAELERAGKTGALETIREYLGYARVHSVRQGKPLGLGHAILQAKRHVGDAPFVVMLPDDLMEPGSRLVSKMIQVRRALGGSVVALLKVTPEQATAYASTSVEFLDIPEGVDLEDGELVRITDVVEKPPIDQVKSEYAVIGRYLLDPAVFEALEQIEPGAGGEYQLTDGYARMIDRDPADGGGLYGVVVNERRFDTGDKLGYLEANVSLALADPRLGPALRDYLRAELQD